MPTGLPAPPWRQQGPWLPGALAEAYTRGYRRFPHLHWPRHISTSSIVSIDQMGVVGL
jgi:hypothetical protein